MKAEIIAVGSELLMGEVVNTNAAWISRELANVGIDVYHHVTVGDNPVRIQGVIRQALERADVLIFTGGLGPTEDDLTIATIADYFKVPLVADPASEEAIRNYFIGRDQPMSKTNIKQALKPEGGETIRNPVGTAPGIAWDITDRVGKPAVILTFPGVPKELYAMWPQGREFLSRQLAVRQQTPQVLVTDFLHFFGIGESRLGELLNDLMARDNPTVAPYVGQAEVKIRVAAKAGDEPTARALIEPVKREILSRAAQYYVGENGVTLEGRVGELLTEKGLRVAVAESCTGGLVSSRLTDVPGSSRYVDLNVVTYANAQKTAILGVKPETLDAVGAVSREVAAEMALGIRAKSGAEIGVGITGIAGPDGGNDKKPVGLAYMAFCGLDGDGVITKKVLVNRNYARADIKYWFSQYALNFLRLYLENRLEPDKTDQPEPSISAAQQ